jgi:hypothetical protein
MSKPKHTPGPWRVVANGGTLEAVKPHLSIKGDQSIDVAVLFHGQSQLGIANARLIAAAPELLLAAKDMLRLAEIHTQDQSEAYQYLEDAVRKAEGTDDED